VLANFISQRAFELAPQFIDINSKAGPTMIFFGGAGNFYQLGGR